MDYHTYVKVRDTIHDNHVDQKSFYLRDYCKDHMIRFKDKQFPPTKSSLCGTPIHRDYKGELDKVVWKRPEEIEIMKNFVLKNEISPDDILQGRLGDCYFLCALSSLAEHPDLILRLFDWDLRVDNGIYSVWLNLNGQWRNYVVDDWFPCYLNRQMKTELAFSRTEQMELWVCVLEKVYAKAYGSYWDIVGGDPAVALRDLTGAPYDRIDDWDNLDASWEKIVTADKNKNVLTCFTRSGKTVEEKNSLGIVQGHAYSILDVQEVIDSRGRRARLLQIRNPWGQFEWKGDFSDNSPLWTNEYKTKLKVREIDDGVFWIKLEDFIKYYQEVCALKVNPLCFSNHAHISMKNGVNRSVVRLVVPNDVAMNISVDAVDSRLVDDPKYSYPLVRLTLARINNNDLEYVTSLFSGEKTLFLDFSAKKGEYILLVEAYWYYPNFRELVVSTYSECLPELEILNLSSQQINQTELKIWKNYAVNNVASMKSMGQRRIGNSVNLETFVFDSKKGAMILRAFRNTGTNHAYQKYAFTCTGIDIVARKYRTAQFAEIEVNAGDWDVILLKFDFTAPKVTLGLRMDSEEEKTTPFGKTQEEFKLMELLQTTQGTSSSSRDSIGDLVSKDDRLKASLANLYKVTQLKENQKKRQMEKEQKRLEDLAKMQKQTDHLSADQSIKKQEVTPVVPKRQDDLGCSIF